MGGQVLLPAGVRFGQHSVADECQGAVLRPELVAAEAGMEGPRAQGLGEVGPRLAGAGDVDDGLQDLAVAAAAAAVVGERSRQRGQDLQASSEIRGRQPGT